MGLFNIFKKEEVIDYNITEEQKKQIENMCTGYLKEIAKEFDKKLKDGSFGSEENYYIWDKHGFIINFFGISQDDYFENIKAFEKIGKELTKKIKTIIDVENAKFGDDYPAIFYKVVNK